MVQKTGFTLSEVLVTLAIVGVVGAMTLPTIKKTTEGAQNRVGFKKGLSALSQAISLNISLDGIGFDKATTGSGTKAVYGILTRRMKILNAVEGTTGYAISSVSTFENNSGNYTLFYPDGTVFSFQAGAGKCTKEKPCKGIIDANGHKRPNDVVMCDPIAGADCKVSNPKDVFPVRFYNNVVEPNSEAARAVLQKQ